MDHQFNYVLANLMLSEHSGGLGMFNLDNGQVLACKSTGARIISALSKGLTIDDISADLAESFGVEFEVVRRDTRAFVEDLTHHGVVRRRPAGSVTPRRITLISRALYELALYEVTMETVGFRGVNKQLMRNCVFTGHADPILTTALCDAVNLAMSLYFRRVQCLQRSVATVQVLWRYGIPGRLVIGYRPSPFLFHAWVEVNDQVVNDSPGYAALLHVVCKY